MKKYTYPKRLIARNAKVIIYGYGEIGRYVAGRILDEGYCSLAGIADKNTGVKDIPGNVPFFNVADLGQVSYDNVLITSKAYEQEIYKELCDGGIDQRKIIFLQENDKVLYDRAVIPTMEIDRTEESHAENYGEYIRYRTLELVCQEIRQKKIKGAVAEAGVYMGNFAKALSYCFPDKTLFLYDTFSGFEIGDIDTDIEKGYTSKGRFGNLVGENIFAREDMTSEQQIEHVKRKLNPKTKVIIRKGNFPESALSEQDMQFCFVSLDMDLYRPTKDGLAFFWSKLAEGGYLFLHDYNGIEHKGVKTALDEFEMTVGMIPKVPLPDQYGTVILIKNDIPGIGGRK